MPTAEIEVENLGPVRHLTIPIPAEGGVVELTGGNGTGKSTTLRGVARTLGGRDRDLSATDGAQRGVVRLGDATLSVTRSRSAVKGELEVVGIESRLDVAALVDPGIASPEAADAKRLKALVSLAGVEGKPELFYELTGGAEGFTNLGIEATDDILLLADRVKRAFEKLARDAEHVADKRSEAAKQIRDRVVEVDLMVESDETTLAENYARARANVTGMINHNQVVESQAKLAATARTQLAALAENTDDPDALQDVENQLRERAAELALKINEIRHNAEREVAAAEALQRSTLREADDLLTRRVRAQRAAESRRQLSEQAEKAIPGAHALEALQGAERAVADALAAIEAGSKVRAAKRDAAAAEREADAARDAARAGNMNRNMAAAVDSILSALLPTGCPLRYEAGRLVCETDRSRSETFADLSDGERWIMAIQFAAAQLPPHGLLTISQTGWAEISRSNKLLIANEARRLGVTILTARVTEGPLAAELLATGPGPGKDGH